ncbi:MAG: type II/IV secretion system ATPase subunit [Candidatus Aenigmarchaeota archaeon]|nr:type II/IV secretion system ATPase subunit [Candidatus Aenigmarchaeota archaeon]
MADYEFDENSLKLRVNCLGALYGASVEDFEEAMARVIDILLEVKQVRSIVLIKEREYEYDGVQAAMLVEIAQVIETILKAGIHQNPRIFSAGCSRLLGYWSRKIQYIVFDALKKDPIGAYVMVRRALREVRVHMEHAASPAELACYTHLVREGLEPIERLLADTQLIRAVQDRLAAYHVGKRDLYRSLFSPTIRPNFMLTRYVIMPPKDGHSLDRYMVGDAQVEIFRVPGETRAIYHIVPPEFRLGDETYAVLDAARKFMAANRPRAPEFVKSERMRDIFYNIGKDMIRETADRMGVPLTSKESEQLAVILTRYTAGLGVLEILLADEKVQDLYINAPVETQPIMIFHQDFEECKTNLIPTLEDAEAWTTRLRIESGRPLDESNPVLDFDITVPGGKARFAVITKSLSPAGLGFAIRRHREKPWTLPLFIKNGMLTPLAAGLLSFLIEGSVSMLIAGGRSSGKTSMLGAMLLEILPKVRILTIEDTLELPVETMRGFDYNIQPLKSRSVVTHVETEMPADEALRTALRLGDSALILGEVRSVEARALYEAMRIGALSNVVAGTIHGESAYGVFDRVVNDLNVPPTSFKATDIIPICKMLRSSDGLHRFRRMTEITEVRKEWSTDPVKEGGFVNLMEYSGKEDMLKPTDVLLNGESQVLNRIASYVRDWSGNWAAVWDNITLRAKMKEYLVGLAEKLKNPDLIEAAWVIRANQEFHLLQERARQEAGAADARQVWDAWKLWIDAASLGKPLKARKVA